MRHNTAEGPYAHVPVLCREIENLIALSDYKGEGLLVDFTIGEGGHSEYLLGRFPGLRIIGFDRDPEILLRAGKRLEDKKGRVEFVNMNFSQAEMFFEKGREEINYMLYDFGVSSFHFDSAERGFAFKDDSYLDMRLDPEIKMTAADILNKSRESELAEIFFSLGQERWSAKIAAVVCAQRRIRPFEKTSELASLVLKVIPAKYHPDKIHPATRVFQALRIKVNDELVHIARALESSVRLVNKKGLVMAISFHSLEDSIVKNKFRSLVSGCDCGRPAKYCVCERKPFVRVLTKKPIVPGEEEMKNNKRSRSAKLRAYVRL